MNLPEPGGESSCKRQENGDVPSGSERPLKKARFAWQVKGKYHLKNESSDPILTSQIHYSESSETDSGTSCENADKDLVGNTEQNLEILGDYLLKQDFNTLDSVITDSDKTLLKPSTSVSTEKLSYPRYLGSYDNKTARSNNSDMSIPMSMVILQNYTEEQCIARWQARQMAKGFVDNTINRVLDSWMVTPIPQDIADSRFIALDVVEFINNLPSDNSIENEGILMAISAHGLQNTSANSCDSSPEKSDSNIKGDDFPSPRSSPVPSEDEIVSDLQEGKQDTEMSSSEPDLSWSYNEDLKRNDSSPLTLYPDVSESSYHYFGENDPLQASPFQIDDLNSHHDFLDAAVSFAIQNKGLTSFGTDYG